MHVVLHAGPPKTGTTTIQSFLSLNREKLAELGVFVPRGQTQIHQELALSCSFRRPGNSRAYAKWGILSKEDLERERPKFTEIVTNWLKDAQKYYSTCIFSCEGLAGRNKNELRRLREIIVPECDSVSVLIFLRRQDLAANSNLKNRVRNQGRAVEVLYANQFQGAFPDYVKILDNWAEIFGEENVKPLVFPDSATGKTDLISTFIEAAGIPAAASEFVDPGRRNKAWDRRAVSILSDVNEHIPPLASGEIPADRKLIERALIKAFPDPKPVRIPRQLAMEICENHAEDNRTVARRWFGRDELFHADFSAYDIGAADNLQPDDYVRVIVEIARNAEKKMPSRRQKSAKAKSGSAG